MVKIMTFRKLLFSKVVYIFLLLLDVGSCERSGNQYSVEVSITNEKLLKNCIFPDTLNLTFVPASEKGHSLTVFLQKNNHLDKDVPVYVTRKSIAETILIPDSGSTSKLIAYYQDRENGDSISVQCSKKSRTVSYDGIVHNKGTQLMVQTQRDFENLQLQEISQATLVKLNEVPASITADKYAHDYTISEKSHIPEITGSQVFRIPKIRKAREIVGSVMSYTIDILVVVDFSVFMRWLHRQYDSQIETRKIINAKLEIQEYYTQVLNGVDLRYKSIGFTDFDIRIKPVGFVIADDPNVFQWTKFKTTTKEPFARGQLNADHALTNFRDWLNKTKGLPEHDHAVFFTTHDLYAIHQNGGRKVKHTSGLAFIGTMCQYGDSVSVVEEQGGFQSVGTTAHEIGHSLGARHDGEDNPCRSEDRFIMAASGFGPVPQDKQYNPWHFSECSVEYFRNFIASLLANGSSCMLESTTTRSKQTDSSMPGQMYNPDEQCRLIWGPRSYLCRGAEFGNASNICTGMYCRDPSTANDCVLHSAARGTSCGNKQWCIEGKCSYSTKAPDFNDGCVLGDQPGAAFNGMSCNQLVNQSPSYCYQSKVRARCCASCQKHFTWRKGCEYGDRVQGCQTWHCRHIFGTRNILSDCCSTCGVGDVIISTVKSHWNSELATTSLPPHICRDSQMSGDMKCESLIRHNGKYVCYSPSVSRNCCKTCRRISVSDNKGCEYGDRSPTLCARISNVTSLYCSKYGTQCCGTCVNRTNGANTTNVSVISVILFLFLQIIYEHVVK